MSPIFQDLRLPLDCFLIVGLWPGSCTNYLPQFRQIVVSMRMRDAGAFRVLVQAYRHYELSHHFNFSIRYFLLGVSFFRFVVDALSSTPEAIPFSVVRYAHNVPLAHSFSGRVYCAQ